MGIITDNLAYVVLALVVVIYLFRRQLQPFWSKYWGEPYPDNSPEGYWWRSRQRINKVTFETEFLEQELAKNKPSLDVLSGIAIRLRNWADQQENELTPHPSLESHKRGYFQIMDLQARKVEDILSTGGTNLESLLEEEEELGRQAQANAQDSEMNSKSIRREIGLE